MTAWFALSSARIASHEAVYGEAIDPDKEGIGRVHVLIDLRTRIIV